MPGGFSSISLPPPPSQTESLAADRLPIPTLPQRAESIAVVPSAESSSTVFGSVLIEPPSPRVDAEAETLTRGRTLDADTITEPSRQGRGTSMPATSRESMEGEADQGLHLPNKKDVVRSAPGVRRATHSSSQSVDISSQPDTPPGSTNSTFSLASSSGSGDSKASTGTFLGNLKSRTAAAVTAAEASNPKAVAQARETLQKWGVQWAGLKKNISEVRERPNSISSSPATSTFSLNTTAAEDVPGTPPSSSISRGFDDMRRIVAERRQREERERVVSDVGWTQPLEVPSDKSKRRESAGPVLSNNPEPVTAASVSPGRSRLARSDSTGSAVGTFAQPPAAKAVPSVVETKLDAAPLPHPNEQAASPMQPSHKVATPSSPTTGGFKTAPIMAQPSYSAMSMVVPGINARNRNEVMSIGFSPRPATPPPAPPKEETGIGTKLQGIGNIYRLLNRNNAEPSGALNAVPPASLGEDNAQYAMTNEEAPRPIIENPPTPPRVASGTTTPRRSVDTGSTSPASAALMSLVQRDTLARRKSLTRPRTGSVGDHQRQPSDPASPSPLAATEPSS